LITDAFLDGYGATLYFPDTGKVLFLGGHWPVCFKKRDIAELETLAVLVAAKHFNVTSFHLVIDNTTTLYAMLKGRSRAFRVNQIAAQMQGLTLLSVGYIQTHKNISDPLSRGETPTAILHKPPDHLSPCEMEFI